MRVPWRNGELLLEKEQFGLRQSSMGFRYGEKPDTNWLSITATFLQGFHSDLIPGITNFVLGNLAMSSEEEITQRDYKSLFAKSDHSCLLS